jgi:hypothetical protein
MANAQATAVVPCAARYYNGTLPVIFGLTRNGYRHRIFPVQADINLIQAHACAKCGV